MCRIRNLIAILILNIACHSLTVTEVCPYATPECDCDALDFIICRKLQEFPPLVTGDNITDYKTIFFQEGNINNVTKNSLPAGIQFIEFSGHPLNNIHDDAFERSIESLEYLSIKGAKFTQLPHALRTLKNLTSLDVFDTPIEVWENTTIEALATSVQIIQLQNVSLKTFPEWFSFFHSLGAVSLSRNFIQFIPEDALLSSEDTLTFLRLESTGLVQIPKVLFHLQNLTSLSLSGNNITDENGRPGVEQLAYIPSAGKLSDLYLNSMGLHEIPDFSNMTSLSTLALENNQISDSSNDSLPLSVAELRLKDNKLTAVPALIVGMLNLYSLDLSHNQITILNFDAFPPGLHYLDLGSNNITVIESSNVTMDSQLLALTLTSNPISTISPMAFKSLTSLTTLYLEQTNLIRLPDALTSLTKLTYLSLDVFSNLACPCPAPQELVQWYSSLNNSLSLFSYCNNTYFLISKYLSSDCPMQLIQPAVRTTPGNDACALVCSVICRYFCLLVLLILNCYYEF